MTTKKMRPKAGQERNIVRLPTMQFTKCNKCRLYEEALMDIMNNTTDSDTSREAHDALKAGGIIL